MSKVAVWLISSLSTFGLFGNSLAQSKPIVHDQFNDSQAGWITIGEAAKSTLSHDPLIVLPNQGAIQMDYSVEKGGFSGIYLPVGVGSWAKAKSIKFRIHSDSSTAFVVSLQKQDGGRFNSTIQVSKDAWQSVELSVSDFILAQDKDDPKDPDGKLDMGKVSGIAIADMAPFFLASENPILSGLLDIKKGPHTFYFDSFQVDAEPVSASASSVGDTVILDGFVHPQLSWIGLGRVKISRVTENPLDGVGLRADYHQTPNKPTIIARPLPSWILTGLKTISLDVASSQQTQLIIQFEQTDGGKYNMSIDVPGGSTRVHKELLLSAFNRADDSTDSDTKIHPGLVKSITVIDVSGMVNKADKDNTLWLNHLIAQG